MKHVPLLNYVLCCMQWFMVPGYLPARCTWKRSYIRACLACFREATFWSFQQRISLLLWVMCLGNGYIFILKDNFVVLVIHAHITQHRKFQRHSLAMALPFLSCSYVALPGSVTISGGLGDQVSSHLRNSFLE